MPVFTRRRGLKAAAALAATGLPGAVLAQVQPAPPPPTGTPARDRAGPPLSPPLADRLMAQGVALAAMRVNRQQVDFGAAVATGKGAAPDADSLFELGSITKTFTALLLADAVTRGDLALDGAVEDVLPGQLPLRDSRGQVLRWRDLATHRSGLPRLPANLNPASMGDPYAHYGWDAMEVFLQSWKPEHPRDTVHGYSNLGYGLLGQALAFKAGLDYPTLLVRRVLQPLGLEEHIGFSAPAGRRFMDGHDAQGQPVPHWRFQPAMAGAGALLGSTRGLARYAQAAMGQFDHPLQAAFALCLQRHGDTSMPMNPVGLGWLLAPLNGQTVFNHDGGTGGFSTSLWLDPSRQRAAAVLSNAQVPVTDLALHLLEPAIPPKNMAATQQPAQTLAAEALAPLTGVYAFSPQFKLKVRSEGQRLFAQATGQGEFELFAKGPRRFFARITPLEVEFAGSTGVPEGLTLFQGGGQMRAVRE